MPNTPDVAIVPVVDQISDKGDNVPFVAQKVQEDVISGERKMITFGRATYSDVFGDSHWTQFCSSSLSEPNGGIPSDLGLKCAAYNAVDTDQSDRSK